jgi:GAF domain-containing protein
MDELTREEKLLNTFSILADTLVADYDVIELLQTLVDACLELLDTGAAGILLADGGGELEVMASTSEASRLVEMMQLAAEAGPCIESYTTGQVVAVPDIAEVPEEWSRFRDSALDQGFRSIHAIPMRLRDSTIGTLNLLRETTGELPGQDAAAAKAFADVATIGILHERTVRERETLAGQLQTALNRRVIIEQAKGFIAHTHGIPVEDAFALIRKYSRTNNIPLSQVAAQIIDFTLELD